ncbi:nuclear transport factor 2 family protein [Alkalicoccus daliensis]|uniref:SnoaL-like domain-containing protein n=1 Tax=Alkalicoccus daliensis TaxID=745820 RepID=A0A1H0HSK9_9BACI|nr:nuclear transport factor 2 family protein [Alkalicoccus daliensis]SDO22195.1 SnoaL-like domain-containing protein [Alkalicoccus daliensis]
MKTKNHIFLEEFNEAFAKNDIAHILESITDDITWKMAGDITLHGKEEVEKALRAMENPPQVELALDRLFIHGRDAAANGIITMTKEDGTVKKYEFCDVYAFHQYKGGKIRKLTSYVVEAKEE